MRKIASYEMNLRLPSGALPCGLSPLGITKAAYVSLALQSFLCPPYGVASRQQFQWMVAATCAPYRFACLLLFSLLSLCEKIKMRFFFDLHSAPLCAIKSDGAARPGGHPASGKSASALSVPSSRPVFHFRICATAKLIFLSPLDAIARKKLLPDASHLTGK